VPNRIVREGIIASELVNKLSAQEEVFYRRLHSVVDDFGRYHANPSLLRAACYPLKLDEVSDQDVSEWLDGCVAAGLLEVYELEGKSFLQVLKFGQQVRAKASKFPDPPTDATQVHSKRRADVVHMRTKTESYSKSETESGAKRRSIKTPMPPDFAITPRVRSWAVEKGVFNLEEHFEHFVSKCKAKGYTYVDWDEGFMGAVRSDWAKIGKGDPGGKRMVM